MTTLTMRSYVGETDIKAIAAFIQDCEAVDRLEELTSTTQLQQEINQPSVDRHRDIRLWCDSNGALIGFGQVFIPPSGEILDSDLWFRVHPRARGGDLEEQIVAWGEERMREVSRERGVGVKLRSGTRDTDRDRLALLERLGYIRDRYFFRMARSLADPIPEPELPAGYTLRSGTQGEHPHAWVEMFNQSFIDHWGFYELTIDRLQHELKDPYYNPEFDRVAIAPDGTFASFCHCYINPEQNEQSGRNEGWLVVLGTRRGFRKQGLASAAILDALHRLKAAGVDRALLAVDAENTTGALHLYESLGFRKVCVKITLVKEL
jgi:mycothiol synthase